MTVIFSQKVHQNEWSKKCSILIFEVYVKTQCNKIHTFVYKKNTDTQGPDKTSLIERFQIHEKGQFPLCIRLPTHNIRAGTRRKNGTDESKETTN